MLNHVFSKLKVGNCVFPNRFLVPAMVTNYCTVDGMITDRYIAYMAEKANHYWFEELNLEKIKLGTSKIQLVSKGTYIPKYKITVPNALNSYEG